MTPRNGKVLTKMLASITRPLPMGIRLSSVYADVLLLLATIARPNQPEARSLRASHWNGRKECGAKVP